MKIEYFLFISRILVTNSVHSIVFSDGLEHLDILLQKSLRYKHHQLNYEETLHRRVIPTFAPIQRKVSESELREDFENFRRRIRIKWHFRNEPSDNFSEKPAFSPKSSWKLPLGHANLEVFLSQAENETFEITKEPIRYSNLSQEEWRAIRTLADKRSMVIKKLTKDLV